MKYYKNTELAKIYNISEKSVRNWIDSAEQGKLELQLYEYKDKQYIANTAKNTYLIEELVEKGKKYKNSRGFKVVVPSPKFYKLYNPKQVLDIISNIDSYHETPLQYSYFNSGAERWDSYVQHLSVGDTPNSLRSTLQLLDLSTGYLDTLLQGYTSVNVIDVGVGNGQPIRGIIEHLLTAGRLNRYIGLDISKEMIDIAKENFGRWFGDKVNFEGHVRDITYERFDDLLVGESFGPHGSETINLIFFLGGTLSNFREPNRALATLVDSMGKKDLLLFSKKLDTEKSRRYFDMASPGNQEIDLVIKLLNIEKSFYELEQIFDPLRMAREAHIRLNVAIAIHFDLNGQERVVELNKGDRILLWRARHQSVVQTIQQFDESGFDIMEAMRSKDGEYVLLINRIKTQIN